jgi:hypothetical protein
MYITCGSPRTVRKHSVLASAFSLGLGFSLGTNGLIRKATLTGITLAFILIKPFSVFYYPLVFNYLNKFIKEKCFLITAIFFFFN